MIPAGVVDFFPGMRYIFHMNNQRRTEEKVFSYIEEHDMISPGHRVVAGVSGGADSVCLLFLLLEYARKRKIKLAVVHVNHGLREDAGEDAEFVRGLCLQEGVPFFLREVNVGELAAREKCSLEEAGRMVRYRAFREVAESLCADRIAVAHTANDRAETMLFHLFRGSGVKGLCGIPPRREEIIRPLLCLERSEIESYLAGRGIPYRLDSTNEEDAYTRNRIRHHILPIAEQEVSAGAVAHMLRTADMLSELEEYLGQQTKEAMADCVVRNPRDGERLPADGKADSKDGKVDSQDNNMALSVDVEKFRQLHIAIQKHLLLLLLQEMAPGGRDISAVHVEDILSLFEKKGNPQMDMPFGIRAVRRYGNVFLVRGEELCDPAPGMLHQEVVLPSGETENPLVYDLGDYGQAEIAVFFAKKGQEIHRNEYTKWLDCDKILELPVFRCRQTGDYFSLADGRGGTVHKSLKDYMINEKIPRESRSRTLLLAEGNHVLWLAGYRISEYYKVTENTKRILQVKLIRNCSGGGTEEKDGRTC